jgi:hypothetical protein
MAYFRDTAKETEPHKSVIIALQISSTYEEITVSL